MWIILYSFFKVEIIKKQFRLNDGRFDCILIEIESGISEEGILMIIVLSNAGVTRKEKSLPT